MLAHAVRLFLVIDDDNKSSDTTKFYNTMYLKNQKVNHEKLSKMNFRDLALISHRSNYSKVYEKMHEDEKEIFNSVITEFCNFGTENGVEIDYCGVLNTYLLTKDQSEVSKGQPTYLTLRTWIISIINPSSGYRKMKKSMMPSQNPYHHFIFEKKIVPSDYLSPPQHTERPINPQDLEFDERDTAIDLEKIYPMGDYEDFEDGHIILELSAFAVLDFKVSHMNKEILEAITTIGDHLLKIDTGDATALELI